ncbi:MAG: PP2C family protein-serine/threonine phosphatase [Planctomycetota bacterium]|nr:PP2C family protein-serine/threonine phosphatase [Planctomycetota bacterium]
MRLVDLSANPRITNYIQMLREVSRATEPTEVQKRFAALLRDDNLVNGFVSLSVRGLPRGKFKITRLNISDDLGVITSNPWRDFDLLPTYEGGFLGEVIRTPEPKLMLDLDIKGDPVLGDGLARFGSCFANPLYDEGEALNWSLTFKFAKDGYTLSDAESFLLRGNIIGRMTKSLVVAKQVRELNERLTQQLEQIAQIQRSLLPDRTPQVPGLVVATSYLTSNEAGGDYYDFFEMGGGKVGVLVADVSGHGAGAATMMAMLQTILHGYQERGNGPAAMLEHANRELMTKRIESAFVTAFMSVYDPETRTLTYSNAGHNRPQQRLRDGRTVEVDGAASVPLGVIDRPEYEEATREFGPGETVLLYTDGITEAFSPPPQREMFGARRLASALASVDGEPLCVIEAVHEKLYEHTHSRDRADDQTLVVLRAQES